MRHIIFLLPLVVLDVFPPTSCAGNISPFSPPFLRAANSKSPSSTIVNYLMPQSSRGNVEPSNTVHGASPDTDLQLESENPSNQLKKNEPTIENSYMFPNQHTQFSEPLPNYLIQNPHQTNENVKVGRPQLRQLDLNIDRAGQSQRQVHSNRQPVPTSNNRRINNNNANSKRNNHRTSRVSEGHRLITRALWRIFDALIEKNQNTALAERMALVEHALHNKDSPDETWTGSIDMIQVGILTIC